MPKQLDIYIKNINRHITVEGGSTLNEILILIPKEGVPEHPICALVNNKTEDLDFPVFMPKQVEFLDASSKQGSRVYVRSLSMMLSKVVSDLYDGAQVRMEHSVSAGFYCVLSNPAPKVDESVAQAVKTAMQRLAEADIPFERCEQLTSEVIAKFEAEGRVDKVRLLRTAAPDLYTVYYRIGDYCDTYYEALAPSTGHIRVFDVKPFHDGLLILPPSATDRSVPATQIKQEKMMQVFTDTVALNKIIGIGNVGDLNAVVGTKHLPMLINAVEAIHTQQFATIAHDISRRHSEGQARVVMIAGPSSSGKTTSSKRLAVQLFTNRIVPKVISLDNYFINRDKTPLDENGEKDFESLYSLDLDQFNTDLARLIAGEEVAMPTYNFESGQREYRGNTLKLNDNDVLLMEGIHGLNPALTPGIPRNMVYSVYVSALTTLSIDDHNWIPTTDNRLLRRLVRDHKYRGTSAQDTIKRWPSVRRGEEKWIFPFQENADATFNSSLLFELAVIKPYAEAILRQVPRCSDEYSEAYRLLRFLSYIRPISEADVPASSILREFLGGSVFHY